MTYLHDVDLMANLVIDVSLRRKVLHALHDDCSRLLSEVTYLSPRLLDKITELVSRFLDDLADVVASLVELVPETLAQIRQPSSATLKGRLRHTSPHAPDLFLLP